MCENYVAKEISVFCTSNLVFPNHFWFAEPLLKNEDIWWHPYLLYSYKDQGIVTISGTPGHQLTAPLCAPRHPGWESLF